MRGSKPSVPAMSKGDDGGVDSEPPRVSPRSVGLVTLQGDDSSQNGDRELTDDRGSERVSGASPSRSSTRRPTFATGDGDGEGSPGGHNFRSMNSKTSGMTIADTMSEKVREQAKGKNHHMAKLLKRAKDPNAVERTDLVELLRSQKDQRDSFLKLPFTIMFFTFFCVAVLNHERVAESSMMQRLLRGMLSGTTFEGVGITSGHKDLGDIDVPADWYLYMQEALIPLFINPLTTPIEDRHRVLRYNQLIGGIQIQQVRRQRKVCTTEYPDLGPFPLAGRTNPILAEFGCYPWYTESEECYGPWNATVASYLKGGFCPDSQKDRELGTTRRLDFVPEGGGTGSSTKGARLYPGPNQLFSVYLYEHEGLDTALEKMQYLQANEWIDYNTAWVGTSMFVLNPDLAIFVHVTVHVYFATSGALLPHITAQSFAPDPYQDMSVLAFDVIWLLLLIWLAFTLIRKLHTAASVASCRGFFLDLWIWVDAGTVFGGIAIIILWLVFLDRLVNVKRLAMEAKALQPQTGFANDEYPNAVAAMHVNLTSLSDYLESMRLVFSLYTIFISLKFLESFSAQPRLAVVTRTIWQASSELFHFMIVLLTMFFSYVIAGMFIFGRRLWEFSEFKHAISKCFLLMLGDFDWEELGDENPLTAAFWFWTFMIVMTLLMMNMLMAIIMDKYTEVKSDAAEHDTIFKQVLDMAVEAVNSTTGRVISVRTLLKKVEALDLAELNVELLCSSIEGLSKEQAKSVIMRTQERVKSQLNKGVTISEAMRMIGWTKIAVQKIGWKLEEVLKEERLERQELRDISKGEAAGTHRTSHHHGNGPSTGPSTELALRPSADNLPVAERQSQATHSHVADAEERLEAIEARMQRMEDVMQEALKYTEFRGKDLRNRLTVIEDLLRSQRDAQFTSTDRQLFDQEMPRLRDRDRGDDMPRLRDKEDSNGRNNNQNMRFSC